MRDDDHPVTEAAKRTRPEPAAAEPLAYTVAEAGRVTGLSRASLYNLRNAGRLRFVRVAGRTVVPAEALRRLITEAPDAADVARQEERRQRARNSRRHLAKAAGGERVA